MIPVIFEFDGKERGISENDTSCLEDIVYTEWLIDELIGQFGYES